MRWQLFVSLRYLTAKRKEKFISLISFISILGVAVGVAALIIVISVMNGFDADLKDKIIGTNSHLVVESDYGINPNRGFLSKILDTKHVVAASFYLNGQVLVRRDESVTGIILKGIEPRFLQATVKAQGPEEDESGLSMLWEGLFSREGSLRPTVS